MTARVAHAHVPRVSAERAAAVVSTLAVLGMLAGALVIVADVLLRWLAGSAVVALNEVMSQVFAIAVAATLPAGAVRRINLKVDLLGGQTGARLTGWLSVAGSLLLAVLFAVLAWFVLAQALKFHAQGRATLLLNWPLAPTGFLVAGALALATLAQLRNAALDVIAVRREPARGGTGWPGLLVVGLFVALVGAVGIWAAADLEGLARHAMTAPGAAVALAFALLWLGVLSQLPLAAVSGLLGLAGTALFLGAGSAGKVWATDATEFLTNAQIATLPLFLMMGSFAVAAGISDDIYRLANALLGRVRGGLAYATVAGCAGFGAVSGSSVATAATFGRIALPQMRARAYAPDLSTGVVAAGGTLGALVPPSGAIILFALLTEQSIATLFVAAMIPALLALALYFGAIFALVRLRPDAAPAADAAREPLLPALIGAIPVALLFGAVIGGLYGGVFTATESAAVGAVGAFVMALARGRLSRDRFLSVMSETTATTALIYGLIFGALIFSFFVNLGQAPEMVARWIAGFDVAPVLILIALLVFYLLLGAVMDSFAVMVITVPVVTPIILGLGYDIYFWGVLMLVVVEIGLITPPFGLNLFVLNSLQPDVPIARIMKGVLPFILADLIKIALLVAFPALALWLPSTMG
ncbi:TRAP transporter large permease [Seohaeicola saemankumensis]|nr:TRAP transporter large permease [Seohaeicola saemankumensis]MCA0871511.1 TRAP transporter large permease [Seohaeicola saemankumensis]